MAAPATFTVQSGGTVNAVDTYVGHLAGSNGTATVTGAGSIVDRHRQLFHRQ